MTCEYKQLDLFAFENFVIENKDSYQTLIDRISDTSNTEYERAEMIFYFAFNLEDDNSDRDDKIEMITQIIDDFKTNDPKVLALLRLSKYFVYLYSIDDFEDLNGHNHRMITYWVNTIWNAYSCLEGLNEDDFVHLKYQFVFDYETDRLWEIIKGVYKKVEEIKSPAGYNQHPLNFLTTPKNENVISSLSNQIQMYFRQEKEKLRYVHETSDNSIQ